MALSCTTAEMRRILKDHEDENWNSQPLSQSGEDVLDSVTGGKAAPEYVPLFSMMDGLTTSLRGKFKDGSESGRAMYDSMFEGGFHADKAQVRQHTAEGYADAIDRSVGARFIRETDPHFKEWALEQGIGPRQADITINAGETFYNQVGLAMRGVDDPNISKQAKAAAAKAHGSMRQVYDLAQKHGVTGFEGDALDNYLPRIYNNRKMNDLFRKHEEGAVREFFFRSIKNFQGNEITDDLARIFAKSMVRTLRRSSAGMDAHMSGGINIDDMSKLREFFTDGLSGEDLTKATVDFDKAKAMLDAENVSKAADNGKHVRAKRRVRLDEGYRTEVEAKDGSMTDLAFHSLLHNDARAVGLRYTQVMAGHIGLARKGIKSQGDFDKALDGLRSREIERGVDPHQIDQEVKALIRGHKLITGRSVEADPGSTGSQLSRTVRDMNFVRSSGSFGQAQLAEYGNTLAIGMGRMLGRNLPEFTNMTARAADGTLDNKVVAQLEDWFGPGSDFMRHPAIRGFDEFGEGFEGSSKLQQGMAKADGTIQVGKRAASVVSFMAPIVTRMERQASVGHVLEFTTRVQKGQTGFKPAKAARWRGAGMSDEMQGKVFANIKAHARFKDGRLDDMNVKDWDADVADAMQHGIRRQASFTVQRNDLGDLPEVMRGTAGRLLFQFKAFMFGSIVKQLERGVHYRDIETFVAWTTSWFIASMAYIPQTYLETIGNPEERAKKLTIEQIAGAGFSRAGWTALLVPIAATIADITGNDGMFNHRYSGLEASLLSLDQNPTFQLLGSAWGTLTEPLDAIPSMDAKFGDAEAQKQALQIIPFNRVLGVKNVLHILDE